MIELRFGAIEASAVAMDGDEVDDFRDHEYAYERAHHVGLFEAETAEAMMDLSRRRCGRRVAGMSCLVRSSDKIPEYVHETESLYRTHRNADSV